ncbi:MAG: hypothetical protein KJ600_01940 [Nanoarchaeota archaeon]|nr:hypothetical protein [Nanoarchaeota archaeon]MBU1103297.1 hypothetical protein [Nanoarchaeota archaeon]
MKKLVKVLLGLFIFFTLLNIFFTAKQIVLLDPGDEASAEGTVSLTILSSNQEIYIHTPEEIYYNFEYYNESNAYDLDLNLSSNFGANSWSYVLEDLKHGGDKSEGLSTTETAPNITFDAVRWLNKITVFGSLGETEANASVVFFVNVTNHAPELGFFPDESFVCEGEFFETVYFNANDIDEDEMTLILELGGGVFQQGRTAWEVTPSSFGFAGWSFANSSIYLGAVGSILTREHVLDPYELTLYAKDCLESECESDRLSASKQVNITVIETNSPPEMEEVENQTIDLDEVNHTLYLEIEVSDIDSGNQTSGNLSFNVSFLSGARIFNISEFGVINFTPVSSDVGKYEVRVCVIDQAFPLERVHPRIDSCKPGAVDKKTACQEFNLTITEDVIIIVPGGGGGNGGGGGGGGCTPIWVCDGWRVCENTAQSLQTGILLGEDYREINEVCLSHAWGGEFCGYQTKECYDANNCSKETNKPVDLQACYYTEDPSCFDGIKNCHDGGCEFLIDCGGPCDACPTCSDGVQNQGEESIDCGGPCPKRCPLEIPAGPVFVSSVIIIAIIIATVIVVVLVYRIRGKNKDTSKK